jgi:hypothetical protein
VVNVSEIPEQRQNPEAIEKDPAADLHGRLKDAVADYRARLTKGLETAEADINQQEVLLKQREVAAAIAAAPDALEFASSLAAALEERRKSIAEGSNRVEVAFEQIVKDLESIN